MEKLLIKSGILVLNHVGTSLPNDEITHQIKTIYPNLCPQ